MKLSRYFAPVLFLFVFLLLFAGSLYLWQSLKGVETALPLHRLEQQKMKSNMAQTLSRLATALDGVRFSQTDRRMGELELALDISYTALTSVSDSQDEIIQAANDSTAEIFRRLDALLSNPTEINEQTIRVLHSQLFYTIDLYQNQYLHTNEDITNGLMTQIGQIESLRFSSLLVLGLVALSLLGIGFMAALQRRFIIRLSQTEKDLRETQDELTEAQRLSHLGNWRWDSKVKQMRWSGEIFRILGLEPETTQPSFEAFLSRVHPRDQERVEQSINDGLRTGHPFHLELCIVLPDGTDRHVVLQGVGQDKAPDKPGLFRGTLQDNTRYHRAQRALKESEELLQAVFDALPVWVSVKDSDLKYIMVNRQVLEDTGMDQQQFLGKTATDLPLGTRQEMIIANELDQGILTAGEKVISPELVLTLKNDEKRDMYHIKVPFRGEDGRFMGIITVTVDITAQKQAEREVQALNEELEHRVTQRTEQVRERERLLRSILEALPSFIFLKDLQGKFLMANRKFLEYWELDPNAPDTWHTGKLVMRSDTLLKHFMDSDARIIQGLDLVDEIYTFVRPNGETSLRRQRKSPYFNENGEVVGIIGMSEDVTKQTEAEAAIRERDAQMRLLLESTSDAIFGVDPKGLCTLVNPSCLEMLGYEDESALLGKNMHALIHHSHPGGSARPPGDGFIHQALTEGVPLHIHDESLFRADGSSFDAEIWCNPIMREGAVTGAVINFLDITDRKKIELELRQSQKMEAVGQLTGGVAHDFNNILQVIGGYSQIAKSLSEDAPEIQSALNEVISATDRAADLTGQLLAFSRQQVPQAQDIEVNDLIGNLMKMLSRVIGENIEMKLELGKDTMPLHVDPGMMEQVLLNLCINARDAMPDGGRLDLATSHFTADPAFCAAHRWASPGSYVLISVTDNGIGMPPAIRDKIFEPFFTTKEVGKGTGLGLATVYGIVQQHKGHIHVYSEPGLGTTFKLYMPLSETYVPPATVKQNAESPSGTETILVVEDDASVLQLVVSLLTRKGYNVKTAGTGALALEVLSAAQEDIHLVLSDVVMPQMSGRELLETVRQKNNEIPFIFSTGYASNVLDEAFVRDNRVKLIQKPYMPDVLYRTVREVLDASTQAT